MFSFRQHVPPLAMDSTKASTGCRTSWKMLIAKSTNAFVFWLHMEWKKKRKNKQTEIIILLEESKISIVGYRDVYYYIPADQQQQKKTVFLLNSTFSGSPNPINSPNFKKIPLSFFVVLHTVIKLYQFRSHFI